MIKRRLTVLGLGLVLLVLAYIGWTSLRLALDVRGIQIGASEVRSAVEAHDGPRAQQSLSRLTERVRGAQDRASSPAWWVVEHLPWVGDDARAVGAVTDAATEITVHALPPLVRASSSDLAASLVPRGGRIDPSALTLLRPSIGKASASFDRAEHDLEPVSTAGLVGFVRHRFVAVRDEVSGAADGLRGASTALRIMPDMLGAQGPRSYVVGFANNAEIRSTGGFYGSVGLVEARSGRIALTKQMAGADIVFPQPVTSQPDAERALYGTQPTEYFVDTNFGPDYPRTSELMRAMWDKRYGTTVDGTITLDVVTLGYLLDATGPVTVDGRQLSGGNVVQELLNDTYLRIKDPKAQDAFFDRVARAVFDRVSNAPRPLPLVEALGRGVAEGRVLVHSFHASEQRVIAPHQIAGVVSGASESVPRMGVYLQDATASKMSYYLRRQVRVQPGECGADRSQSYQASAVFSSVAPPNAAQLPEYITGGGKHGTPPGQQLVKVRIYAPIGGSIGDFSFDGKKIEVPVVKDNRRPVASTALLLSPQQRTTVRWRITTAAHQTSGLALDVTPGLDSGKNGQVVADACR